MKISRVLGCCAIGWSVLYLAGCSTINDVSLGLFASKPDSYLLVNGQLLSGSVYLIPGRSGRVEFSAAEGTISACNGTFRYSGTNSGEIDLRCSDGSAAVLKVTLITETRGFAYGSTETAPVSLTFGLSEQASQSYLTPSVRKNPLQDERILPTQ